MDEHDWEVFIKEWQESIGVLVDTNQLELIPKDDIKWFTSEHSQNVLVRVPDKKYVENTNRNISKKEPKLKTRNIKYETVEKETFKAKLFVINTGMSATYAAWIPKSAIIKENYPNLEFESWVNYKEIDIS